MTRPILVEKLTPEEADYLKKLIEIECEQTALDAVAHRGIVLSDAILRIAMWESVLRKLKLKD